MLSILKVIGACLLGVVIVVLGIECSKKYTAYQQIKKDGSSK